MPEVDWKAGPDHADPRHRADPLPQDIALTVADVDIHDAIQDTVADDPAASAATLAGTAAGAVNIDVDDVKVDPGLQDPVPTKALGSHRQQGACPLDLKFHVAMFLSHTAPYRHGPYQRPHQWDHQSPELCLKRLHVGVHQPKLRACASTLQGAATCHLPCGIVSPNFSKLLTWAYSNWYMTCRLN